MKCHIYVDNAATTKLDTVAFEAMTPIPVDVTLTFSPSSIPV